MQLRFIFPLNKLCTMYGSAASLVLLIATNIFVKNSKISPENK